jgi:hypothetical protein
MKSRLGELSEDDEALELEEALGSWYSKTSDIAGDGQRGEYDVARLGELSEDDEALELEEALGSWYSKTSDVAGDGEYDGVEQLLGVEYDA